MEYKGKMIEKRAVGIEAEFVLYLGWYISGHCCSKETVQSLQFSSRDESSRINGKKTLNTGDKTYQRYQATVLQNHYFKLTFSKTHWWAAPLYQKQQNRSGLNNWRQISICVFSKKCLYLYSITYHGSIHRLIVTPNTFVENDFVTTYWSAIYRPQKAHGKNGSWSADE